MFYGDKSWLKTVLGSPFLSVGGETTNVKSTSCRRFYPGILRAQSLYHSPAHLTSESCSVLLAVTLIIPAMCACCVPGDFIASVWQSQESTPGLTLHLTLFKSRLLPVCCVPRVELRPWLLWWKRQIHFPLAEVNCGLLTPSPLLGRRCWQQLCFWGISCGENRSSACPVVLTCPVTWFAVLWRALSTAVRQRTAECLLSVGVLPPGKDLVLTLWQPRASFSLPATPWSAWQHGGPEGEEREWEYELGKIPKQI